MYCIDWDDLESPLIYGSFVDDMFQSLNVLLVPCNFVGRFRDHTIPPNCNPDLQSQKEYVGANLRLEIMYNRERIDFQNFGESTIVKESYILETVF